MAYLGRGDGGGGRGMEVGEEGDYIAVTTLSPPDDSCLKMGSDESHFNV